MSEQKIFLQRISIIVPANDALAFIEVASAIVAARIMHEDMHSAHEGYAVMLEELNELWDEIKKKESERNEENLILEASHVAAMAIRFLSDVCREPKDSQYILQKFFHSDPH